VAGSFFGMAVSSVERAAADVATVFDWQCAVSLEYFG